MPGFLRNQLAELSYMWIVKSARPTAACLAAVAAFSAFIVSTSSARAASDRVRSACRQDYFRHCSAHALGSASLRQCMRDVGVGLSMPCIVALVQEGEVSKEDYDRLVGELVDFLDGETDTIVKRLETEMQEASDELEFERAARLRDRLGAVRKAIEKQQMVVEKSEDLDVVGIELGLAEAAERLGIAAQTLARIEGGREVPWPAVRRRMATVYGNSESELFADIDDAQRFLKQRAGERAHEPEAA